MGDGISECSAWSTPVRRPPQMQIRRLPGPDPGYYDGAGPDGGELDAGLPGAPEPDALGFGQPWTG